MTERVYLAGPMTWLPWFNFHTFDSARDWLALMGFEVVSPADLDRGVGIDPTLSEDPWAVLEGFDLREAARRDLEALMGCSGIVLLPGWWNSKGATAELATALWLGLRVWELLEDSGAPGWVLRPGADLAVGVMGDNWRCFRLPAGRGTTEDTEDTEGGEGYMDGKDGEDKRGRAGAACGGGSEE